jgi:hypothetical protein
MKKRLFIIVLSVILAAVFAAQPTAKAASETAENHKEYISEVKIGVGKTADEAARSLDGYTILSDNGKNVDLNQGAGGGIGSKGERVVYLGYKTTTDRSEAITDLAVMNMKGGYSVKDYELLMEQYMTEQVIPFVDKFLAAIKEYRENYTSEYPGNSARAQYVHDALNKYTDDDCNNAGLGDLLLNETKYEMGDAAYEALSESEKAKHADILTIIAQANGKATLMIESLITRAADTNEDSWIERFVATSYDDLLALYPDMLPSDAANELAKEYDDDAKELLSMWSALKEQLDNYDKKIECFELLSAKDLSKQYEIIEKYDPKTATEEQTLVYAEAMAEIEITNDLIASLYEDISIRDYLSTVEFRDNTLLDYFSQDYKTVKNDITILYPLVASLSEGQRAGLEFITLSDLVMFTASNGEGYETAGISELDAASIYEDVDRDIYKKGCVALTNEALRARAAEEVGLQSGALSALTYAMYGFTALSAVAFGYSIYARVTSVSAVSALARDKAAYLQKLSELNMKVKTAQDNVVRLQDFQKDLTNELAIMMEPTVEEARRKVVTAQQNYVNEKLSGTMEKLNARSPFSAKLVIGFGVAMVVLSAASLYMTYRDLVDHYSVDYTPIPNYIVDEANITAYNEKGEKIVIKNLAAYYKVVECGREKDDEWFEILGTSADLNGTVGRQWLALYTAKNENMDPIIASSLKVVIGSDKVPADYTTGIHMFGSEAAYNLNNTQFVWNSDAKSIYVYFEADDTLADTSWITGSSFTSGYFVLAAIAGLAVGAAAAVCITVIVDKKRRHVKEQ